MDSEFDTLSARYSPASSNKLTGFKAKQKFKIKNQNQIAFLQGIWAQNRMLKFLIFS